jgi:hypothetical protein
MQQYQPIIKVSTSFGSENAINNIATTHSNSAPTVRQRFTVLHYESSKGCAMAFTHNQAIGHHYGQKYQSQYAYNLQTMSGQWSMHNVWLYVFHNLRAFQ